MGDQEQIQQWFKHIDQDGNGQLNAAELQRALALGNMTFGLNDVDQMIRAFDRDASRTLGYDEFVRLHNFLTNVRESFLKFDVDNSQELEPAELMSALKQAGFSLDPPSLHAMINKVDPDASGTLNMDEYIRMCLFLQTASRTFQAFDHSKRGRVDMDFRQFVYACSHVS